MRVASYENVSMKVWIILSLCLMLSVSLVLVQSHRTTRHRSVAASRSEQLKVNAQGHDEDVAQAGVHAAEQPGKIKWTG